MKNKVLVIGSNSFSGSNFSDYLLTKKKKVIGISRSKENNKIFLKYKTNKLYKKNFLFKKIDINKNKDLEKLIRLIKIKKIKYIVNFASQGMVAESWEKPWDWYNTNVVSFSKLVKKIKDVKLRKFLNFSTPEVYGNTVTKIKENMIFKPSTPYAISRAAQDLNFFAYYKTYNFPVVYTRTANIYGPHQQLYRIIPLTIMNALKNKQIHLHGSGNSIRSFIYMDDVSKILYQILFDKKNIGQTYHISTKKFISIKNLIYLILKMLGKKKNLIKNVKERNGKDHGYFLNSSKAEKSYKCGDKKDLENGLKHTIRWYLNNFKKLYKERASYIHKK
jgi:dTDP-glucose 4,6-dehydratase